MAHSAQINVNGVLTTVTEFDNSAQAIDDAVSNMGAAATPQAALSALGAGVRPNLLDNAYFGSLINQMGSSVYTKNGQTADRYILNFVGSGNSGSFSIDGGILTSSQKDTNGYYAKLEQRIENASRFAGKTLTLSTLISSAEYPWLVQVWRGIPATEVANSGYGNKLLQSVTFTVPADIGDDLLRLVVAQTRGTVNIVATKLEEGPNQTLAYQDSTGAWHRLPQPEDGDYAGQLAKCQQYLVPMENAEMRASRVTTSAVRAWFPTPVPMRTDPVLSSGSFQVKTLASGTVMSVAVWSYQVEGCGVTVTATLAGHGQTDGTIYSNAAVLSAQL